MGRNCAIRRGTVWEGRPQRATAPYPEKDACLPERVRRVTRNPGGRRRDHPPRLNTDQ